MAYTVKLKNSARKMLKKLDSKSRNRIVDFLYNRIPGLYDSRQIGAPLKGNLSGFWKYRVGNYRIICDIIDKEVTILVIEIDHRKDIYD